MSTTILSRKRTAIPTRSRKQQGRKVAAGDGGLAACNRPGFDEKRARAVLGCMKEKLKGRSVAGWLEWLRGPVELPPNATRRR